MVFSIFNINISVEAAPAKSTLNKVSLKKTKKKEKINFSVLSFNKKNTAFSFNKKTKKGTLTIKNTKLKYFRQRMKMAVKKLGYSDFEQIVGIKYKTKKFKKSNHAKIYITVAENVSLSAKKRKASVVVTATSTVTVKPSTDPEVTSAPEASITPAATPKEIVYGATWAPDLKAYPTFEPTEIAGNKLSVKSEDYYHKIIVPDSVGAATSYSYSVADNVYTTKVKLTKMTSTYSDQITVDDNADLISVSCEKTASKTITVTLTSNKRLACYSVKTDGGVQIWTCPYVPEKLYFNSAANQAKVFLEGMTVNSVVSSGNSNVTYALSTDRKKLTISCKVADSPVQEYDMAYSNGKINRVTVQQQKGIKTIRVDMAEPMYVRVKNNVKKNKCTLFLYNNTKMKNNYSVVLDAGHGGKDNGATSTYKNSDGEYVTADEKTINLDIILKINDILKSKGMPTILTRDSDKYVSLQDRVKIANNSKGKMFVSVHQNSFDSESAKGTETYYYGGYAPSKNGGFDSKTLAEQIQEELILTLDRDTSVLDRGVKTANFYVIKNSNMPAILAEIAFISNPQDRSLLINESFRQLTAIAIVNAIEKEFFQ